MAALIYSMITSLDGYVSDADGDFGWAAPDEQVHTFVNELERSVGTYLYGRRMYDTMLYWESPPADLPEVERDYAAIWQAADKVVYSRSVRAVSAARTRIEHEFDPDAIRQLKESASSDLTVGGASLAGQAIRAGLVDEIHLLVAPHVVGGGTRALPTDVRLHLTLLDARRFDSGTVYLRYRVVG